MTRTDSRNRKPKVGLSLMIEGDFLASSYPLFESGEVEALEWSFDLGWTAEGVPSWAEELLDFYGQNGALYGHGVTYSTLSATWSERDSQWIERVERECARRTYQHVSEHYGFMRSGRFVDGTPLPVPHNSESLAVGKQRLERLARAAGTPVGLENLAFAFGHNDLKEQGAFMDELLRPLNGFLVLDLHNLYCLMENFQLSGSVLLGLYRLNCVKELHLSGGSWSQSDCEPEKGRVRRDTHDDSLPEPVFELLSLALDSCPHVEVIVLERLGGTLASPEQSAQLRADFRKVAEIVQSFSEDELSRPDHNVDSETNSKVSQPFENSSCVVEFKESIRDRNGASGALAYYQSTLLENLFRDVTPDMVLNCLRNDSALADYSGYIDLFEPRMIETAQQLVKKWGRIA